MTTLVGGGSSGGTLSGSLDGTGSAALFNYMNGIAVTSMGTVYVSDSNIRSITPTGRWQ